ncbi:hypothetical protein Bca4012_051255 [Brassica carinata]|uniref:Uncharacterized protein n=1 Tax=Brassica carinata TaxID=52824 RepID=A0A8X7R7E5_BRACI|nr:hypothetical protein Bca52824_053892 [Brassica carinata]
MLCFMWAAPSVLRALRDVRIYHLQSCMDELVIKFPRLKEVRGCVVLALNEEYSHC